MIGTPFAEPPACMRDLRVPGLVALRLSGVVDARGVQALRPDLDALELGGRRLVVDLSEVSFLDCDGLTMLVDLDGRCAGSTTLVVGSRAILRLLDLTGLDRAFRIRRRGGGARPSSTPPLLQSASGQLA